jgi:hypothetical protein
VSGDVTNGPDATIHLRDGLLTVGGIFTNERMLDLRSGLVQVTGDYFQTSASTLSIGSTDPADLGRLEIGGIASLAGNFQVNVGGTFFVGDRYQFMTFAGGRQGFFTSIGFRLS